MKPQKPPEAPLTKETSIGKDDAAKLYAWLAPHVEAINGLHERLAAKKLDEYDEIRFHAERTRHFLKELQYVAGKTAGVVSKHWMETKE